jgi:hypothetical protein
MILGATFVTSMLSVFGAAAGPVGEPAREESVEMAETTPGSDAATATAEADAQPAEPATEDKATRPASAVKNEQFPTSRVLAEAGTGVAGAALSVGVGIAVGALLDRRMCAGKDDDCTLRAYAIGGGSSAALAASLLIPLGVVLVGESYGLKGSYPITVAGSIMGGLLGLGVINGDGWIGTFARLRGVGWLGIFGPLAGAIFAYEMSASPDGLGAAGNFVAVPFVGPADERGGALAGLAVAF